jgi:hydroxyacylglutathione hydrolase
MRLRVAARLLAGFALLGTLLVAFAPEIYAEVFMALGRLHVRAAPLPADPAAFQARPGPAAGFVVDDYWRVEKIARDTWAIGEPQNDPDNYEYLLLGRSRALLIDSGATARDIHTVLVKLTLLPVTVIPTHLHFDHTNGLVHFKSIALIDLPEIRAREHNGVVHLGRYQYMGSPAPSFHVTEWVRPNAVIDLGGRRVQVLWTPGHTSTSASFYDPATKLLFTGDLIYPTTLYAFLPDSSLSAYQATADRLLATLPADTRIYGGHCCRNDAPPEAPWLNMNDLRDLRAAVANIRTGKAKGRGFVIRRFPVNSRMTILTLYPLGNR